MNNQDALPRIIAMALIQAAAWIYFVAHSLTFMGSFDLPLGLRENWNWFGWLFWSLRWLVLGLCLSCTWVLSKVKRRRVIVLALAIAWFATWVVIGLLMFYEPVTMADWEQTTPEQVLMRF